MARGKRMAGVDQFDQAGRVDMRVDLRGGDVGMAQQRLEDAQVRASSQEVGRKGVAQDMRADPVRRNARLRSINPRCDRLR